MKTKAIEFLDNMVGSFECISSLNIKDINNKKNEIVFLLERGEKYEEMWRGLKLGLDIPKINLLINGENICKTMKEFEQKYFPEEVTK